MSYHSKKEKTQIALAITLLLIAWWLFVSIAMTVFYFRDKAFAEDEYLSAEAFVMSVSSPKVRKYGKGPFYIRDYIYPVNCSFRDQNGIIRYGILHSSSKNSECIYQASDKISILYSPEFEDGDSIYGDPIPKPEPFYYFLPWVLLIITIFIHIWKRKNA